MSKRFEWDDGKRMYTGVRDNPYMLVIPLKDECCQELIDICKKSIADGREFRNFQVALYYDKGSDERIYIDDAFSCDYTAFDKDIGRDMTWSAHLFESPEQEWDDLFDSIMVDLLSDEKTRVEIEKRFEVDN